MRRLVMLVLLALLPLSARADALALVLGTGQYDTLDDLLRAAHVTEAADELEAAGFRVLAVDNGGPQGIGRALADFAAAVPEADRLLVVLSGRFATDGTRTWYLTRQTPRPSLLGLDDRAVSVDSLLTILAGRPSRALLILGIDPEADDLYDPWLREGLGPLAIPQGVTVLIGPHRRTTGFVTDQVAQPGADLSRQVAAAEGITGLGYLPRGYVFTPRAGEAAAGTRPGAEARETALWQGAAALGTVEAYGNYLDAYPQGRWAGDARAAIAAIRAEPNREQRLAEEALGLTREQRRTIQRNLSLLDFDPRGVDGIFGPGTRRAITDWQQQNGFGQTAYLDREQIERLAAQAARRSQQIETEAERTREALERADRAFWEETGARGDEAGLRAYLERHPEGLFARNAQERLDAIAEDKRRVAAAQERAAWDAAREADTTGAYRRYLEAHPEGSFVEEARARIAALGSERSEAETRAQAGEASLGLNALTARVIEQRLDALGLNPGAVDGRFDGDTRRALRGYQRDRGLTATGFLDEPTLVRLLADTLGQRLEE
ncbi:peptidoglycan-binding protein [Rubellimicrobium roseum]|uniref:Peptidoglycan-binding protein n=1 Tax=Rubellimicrobium roseum TaxID=687525 RepID=A0A5C4NJ16_9RHOB|nr:peptidoglycan-binding protein [Rubellimicrobium roseum]TNC72389.1 peptidoglycan-binding protein [Rubellimicrobium roseum]